MSKPYLIATRGCGRSGFPVYMRTVSIYSNNYLKLHGMPMMRHVHLRKIEKKRINEMLEYWINFNTRFRKEYFGVGPDVDDGYDGYHLLTNMRSDYDIPAKTYGQPLINQNAVVKIVTRGEGK